MKQLLLLAFVLSAPPVLAQGAGSPVPATGPTRPRDAAPVIVAVPPIEALQPLVAVTVPESIGPITTAPVVAITIPEAFGGEAVHVMAARELMDQDREQQQAEREAQRQQAERDREAQYYDQAYDAMNDSRWERAVGYLSRVIDMKGTRADAALYWKAYAQNRLGQRPEALGTIGELTKGYPNSRYLKQARVLEAEVRNASGQPVRPQDQSDEEIKLMALNALQHTDPAQAIPMIEKLLEGTGSPRLKSQALFVLAQSSSPRAREVLKSVARGTSTPELQMRAIQYLGVHGGRESRDVLAEIYASSTDVDVKRRILRAFMASGDKERVFAAAQNEKQPELRREAVNQLGAMGAQEELWQLYTREGTVEVKQRVLQALFTTGNATRLIEVAKTDSNPELRRTAVRQLGQLGSRRAGDSLVEIYAAEKDENVKKAAINGLFQQGNAAALVAIARKEPDITMKKEIVQRLSQMGNNKEATAYLLEILNK